MRQPPGSRVASCENCRRRKLRCDRGNPCDTCVARGQSHTCSYARPQHHQQQLVNGNHHRVGSSSSSSNSSERKVVLQPQQQVQAQQAPSDTHRSLLQGIDDFQLRLSQFRSSILERSLTTNSLNSHIPLLDVLGQDSIAIHAISLLPSPQVLQDSAAFYFTTIGVHFYCMTEFLFAQEFEQRHSHIARVQSLLQEKPLDTRTMAEAYRTWRTISSPDYLVYLGLILAIHASSITWGFEDPASRSDRVSPRTRQVHVSSLFAACHQIYVSIDPLLRPTISSLRLSICLMALTCITKGSVKMVGLLAEAGHIVSVLSLDKEPPRSIEAAEARDRLHLFVTVAGFDWVGQMTLKPYIVLQEDSTKHPLLFGNASTSVWADVEIDGVPIVTMRMRYKALLASTSRKTSEYVNSPESFDFDEVRNQLEARYRELTDCIPELGREVRYTGDHAIAHTCVHKTFIEVQRLYLTRKGGQDKGKLLCQSAQTIISLTADSIRSISSSTFDTESTDSVIPLVAGIRYNLIPRIWYPLQLSAVALHIVSKGRDKGIIDSEDAQAKKDNQVCQRVLEELEHHGMGVSKAMTSKPFVKVFEDEPEYFEEFAFAREPFASPDDLNSYLSWPTMEDPQQVMDLFLGLLDDDTSLLA